jgi:hypothetical protein
METDLLAMKYPAGDPVGTAEAFAAGLRAAGYALDFSMASLETEVDRALLLPLFHRGREHIATNAEERNEAALGAYVGETLRRLFGGEWVGSFDPDSTLGNFYLSAVRFGEFWFRPHAFVSYRLTNGECEGTFGVYLQTVLQRIDDHAPHGDSSGD